MCRICTPLRPGQKEDLSSNTVEDAAQAEHDRAMDLYEPGDEYDD